jgi:hypothetical protein
VDDFDRLEGQAWHVVEQALTSAEDYRDDVQDQFVDRARGQCLLDDRGSAGDVDVTVAGGRPGPAPGRLRTRR